MIAAKQPVPGLKTQVIAEMPGRVDRGDIPAVARHPFAVRKGFVRAKAMVHTFAAQ